VRAGRRSFLGGALVVGTIIASPCVISGQQPGATSAPTAAQIQARHEIAALEGVLENAVRYGAQMLGQHLEQSNASNMVLLSGAARSRGFRLDGYGVIFDVEFPSVRRSIMWSMRALGRPDPAMIAAMQDLRKNLQSVTDLRTRQELERALKIFEAQLGPVDAPPAAAQARMSSLAASTEPAAPKIPDFDPRAVYLSELTNALMDAIVDHGTPLAVAQDEWLTVAARESVDRRFVADDPDDTVMTLILRIKGSDLAALRERRVSRDEARKRVEVKRY
jgi:hypothetical protein